jgi:nicotinamidase-related amidase
MLTKSVETPNLELYLRTRVKAFKGSNEWEEVYFQKDILMTKTAMLICDVRDKHWCAGASQRVDALVVHMAPLIDEARACGIQIIHAPSGVMDFYRGTEQRQRVISAPKVEPPPNLNLSDPPLPIDDSNGGCDTPDKPYEVWTSEHPAIHIGAEDGISDSGHEVYNFFRQHGIMHLLVMGVHTNICVLRRSFGIRQMTNWGINCILLRDLTDAMYSPNDRPYVSHEQVRNWWFSILRSTGVRRF